jgi:diguanylate cyclase (GGDEF)-like protein
VSSSEPFRRSRSAAEVLLWQSRFRLVVFGGIMVSFLAFRLSGLMIAESLGAQMMGERTAMLLYALAAGAYVVVVLVARRRLQRDRRAADGMVILFVTADLAIIHLGIFLASPPTAMERGLLLSFVPVLLTQLYFGRLLTTYVVGLGLLLYLVLLGIADWQDGPVRWIRELWTLQIFVIVTASYLVVQGGVARRLARLVRMFDRVEEGDFSHAYDVSRDHRPDNVTMVGRAYNAMRTHLAGVVLTDPLSGCLNRRGFEQELAQEMARAARAQASVALLALDLDHFKLINDSFGHLAGDVVIQEIGELLRETARTGDVVARVGGEEFVVLAPDTDVAGACRLANRVADAVRQCQFRGVAGRVGVTVSLGVVADVVTTESHVYDLRARADEALYAAKRAGRNRVILWARGLSDPSGPPTSGGAALNVAVGSTTPSATTSTTSSSSAPTMPHDVFVEGRDDQDELPPP